MRCVISVAVGGPYPIQVRRLAYSVAPYVDSLLWNSAYPPGSPTHQDVMYGFKPHAFVEAQKQGYTSILWCDASVWARKDPAPVFEIMEREGHCFFSNGWMVGQWMTDASLEKHNTTRDEALTMPDFTGCCMGLDLTNERSSEFLKQWKAAAEDGVSFIGPWNNNNLDCSPDERCLGHRHDQAIGSLLSHRLGMKHTPGGPGNLFSYYTPLMDAGDPEYDSVVLVNGK